MIMHEFVGTHYAGGILTGYPSEVNEQGRLVYRDPVTETTDTYNLKYYRQHIETREEQK